MGKVVGCVSVGVLMGKHGHTQFVAGLVDFGVEGAVQWGADLHVSTPRAAQDSQQLLPGTVKALAVVPAQCRLIQWVHSIWRVAVPRNRQLHIPQSRECR
ncbi:hypothetical protein JZ751_013412 [Albula glossodonta]|uniref:Uncharacterized protein n=1 Tax=Albula glossodonta TaxID=121402 RepID=A0A8T2MZ29_9TELE|nr:hypothetical protein JZ751_013412 [Albula glossodonta]